MDKYEMGDIICEGKSSAVYKIVNNNDLCIKCVWTSDIDIMDEYRIHKYLGNQHPNILPLINFYRFDEICYFILPYMEGGDLYEYGKSKGVLSEKEGLRLFQQLVSALLYCHYQGVVHRDVKPENILLSGDHKNLYLTDFGLSCFLPYAKDTKLTVWCGSPTYAAPEIINREPYDGTLVDVWSAGVVLYVILTGVTPDTEYPEWLSDPIKHLLRGMLEPDPQKRFTMTYVSEFIEQLV